MDDFLSKILDECFKILDENMDILAQFEMDLEDEQYEEIIPNMQLFQLLDMTEDVAESSRIKLAEINFTRRQTEEFG